MFIYQQFYMNKNAFIWLEVNLTVKISYKIKFSNRKSYHSSLD